MNIGCKKSRRKYILHELKSGGSPTSFSRDNAELT